ncbi:MAG: hypothetical protein ACK4TT_10220 [Phenylobacterium sp.]
MLHWPDQGRTERGVMTDYRLYFLDEANHIRGVVEFDGEDDADAAQRALDHADGRGMELWSRDRLVQRFERRAESA